MENYNFQIKEDNKDWENTQARTLSFKTEKEAYKFAGNLSELFNKEVRVTVGDYNNGTYINCTK